MRIAIERRLFTCNVCGKVKPISDFPKTNRGVRGFQGICKRCKADWMREDRKKNLLKYRFMDLKQLYGTTPEEYTNLYQKQDGKCAICRKKETSKNGWLHIDHHHLTGKVRGLLCGNCNTAIGKLGEDISVLEAAIEYLRGWCR